MKKIIYLTIVIFGILITKVYSNDAIKSKCLDLGFEDGTSGMANCRLELLLLDKQTKLEEKKLKAAEAQTRASQEQAAAAQATALATQSIANSHSWRNSQTLMKSGQEMLSGGCTLGIDC